MAIEEISAERFIFQDYEPDYWGRLGMTFSCGVLDIVKKAKEKCIGYCDGSRLAVRPRTGTIAVLCEDEDGYFWFHLEGCGKEAFLEQESYDHLNKIKLDDIDKGKFDRYQQAIATGCYDPPEENMSRIAARAHLDTDDAWTISRNYQFLKDRYYAHVD